MLLCLLASLPPEKPMKLVTAQQMRSLDEAAIKKHGMPSLSLMERAGGGVADVVASICRKDRGQISIVAGKGNNGGDGLVAARYLIERGFEVAVILLAGSNDLSPDARANWERLAAMTTHIHSVSSEADLKSTIPSLAASQCIVDAIFGTGLTKEVRGIAKTAIELIASLGSRVVAVDISSGLSADTGLVLGIAAKATHTVTFGLPKVGLAMNLGPEYSGAIHIIDIGIPEEEVSRIQANLEFIGPEMFEGVFGKRRIDSHKGTYGHVVVFAGSRGHLGAGYLASLAALRSGCGLATYCLPKKAFAKFDARYPEIMCDEIPDADTATFIPEGLERALEISKDKTAVVLGPAIGTEKPTGDFVNEFVRRCDIPLVLDADGLNVLDIASLKARRASTILTPHPGEMGRLMGVSAADVQRNRIGSAIALARSSGAIVVLKGAGTVVATPDGRAAINKTGNPGMATAGMGDALTGIIAAFIAEGMEARTAAVAAAYVHGLAGDMAADEIGQRALITGDVIKQLGHVMKEF